MKMLFLIHSIIFSSFLFAQINTEEKPTLTFKDAKKMAVYFGCENLSENNDLLKCFNQNLNQDIQSQIAYFSNIADYLHIDKADAKVSFVINEEGFFDEISSQGVNPIFNSVAVSSLILMNNKMKQAKVNIKPAVNVSDQPVRMKFNMPIRFLLEEQNNEFDKFPAENRVVFTIKTDEEDIEVRIDKAFNLTTYGKSGDREYYLGKFSNLFEMASVDPYSTAFDTAFKSGVIDITKGKIEDKEYKLQIKNFFDNDPSAQVVITVVREENGSWAEYYEYKTKKEFNQSKFAQLTYR